MEGIPGISQRGISIPIIAPFSAPAVSDDELAGGITHQRYGVTPVKVAMDILVEIALGKTGIHPCSVYVQSCKYRHPICQPYLPVIQVISKVVVTKNLIPGYPVKELVHRLMA